MIKKSIYLFPINMEYDDTFHACIHCTLSFHYLIFKVMQYVYNIHISLQLLFFMKEYISIHRTFPSSSFYTIFLFLYISAHHFSSLLIPSSLSWLRKKMEGREGKLERKGWMNGKIFRDCSKSMLLINKRSSNKCKGK